MAFREQESIFSTLGSLFVLLAVIGFQVQTSLSQDLETMSVAEMEDRLAEIDQELKGLSQYSLGSGVGAIGFRSQRHKDPDHLEWIQIDFEKEFAIDELVLVPSILRDVDFGFKSDAFPTDFRVVAGTSSRNSSANDELDLAKNEAPQPVLESGIEVASFDSSDHLAPRIAPVVINCGGIKASWIRVEATKLQKRRFDEKYIFQLAEILVFSGADNVANSRPVRTSTNVPSGSPAWDKKFAVDGFLPYIMNTAKNKGSLAFVSKVGIGDKPSLTIDLKQAHPVSEIRLHVVDQGDTVPQTFSGDFGIPETMLIEGALESDFSDTKPLFDFHHRNSYDIGPIISRRFPATQCRYIRLTAIEPYLYSFEKKVGTRIGFAEIEIFANGKNVGIGKEAHTDFGESDFYRSLAALTDGKNRYGQIIQTVQWMKQLARRHDLEAERPIVAEALTHRFQKQRVNLNRLIGLSILLALGAVSAIYVGWSMRARAIRRTREQIAADLHDEIGGNFHAIGLLSDLALESSNSQEKLDALLRRIRELTERTGTATAYCANMLESVGLFDELELDMRRASQRITADLTSEFTFEGREFINQLSPRKRIGLFLFYKECLTNVIRHSKATCVSTELTVNAKELCLKVEDNGQGIQETFSNGVPPSLRRRARLLGGVVKATSIKSGGTELELILRLRKPWPISMFNKSKSNRT